jgi:hypothetical protein
MQTEMRLFGAMKDPKLVDEQLIAQCQDARDALRLCAALSDFTHETICDHVGVDKGHWSRMMQGRAHFPIHKLPMLERFCGNYCVTQFLARQQGFELQERSKDQRIRELEAQLREIKAA